MALHNFKVTATGVYVSKAPRGHDSNPGTNPEAPKASPSQMNITAGVVNVIGSGVYIVPGLLIGANNSSVTFRCDGYVVIDFVGTGTLQSFGNYIGFIFKDGVWGGNQTSTFSFTGCTFISINGGLLSSVGVITLTTFKSINSEALSTVASGRFKWGLKDGIIIGLSSASQVYQVCNLINTYVGIGKIIQFNIAAAGAVPTITGTINTSLNALSNCNVNGLIRLPIAGGLWQDYAIQDQYTGTPQDNGYPVGVNWLNESNLTADGFIGTVSGWNAVVATLMNRDPKFLDAANGNFLLASDSPHINAAFGGAGNIGATDVGIQILNSDHGIGGVSVLASPEIDTTVPTNYFVKVGDTEGYVDYVARIDAPILRLDILDAFTFDVSFAGGTPQNDHVPDSQPLNSTYAKLSSTIASGSTTQFILDNSKVISINEYASILGETRLITNVEANTPSAGQKRVTVASAYRATIGSGVEVTYGTEAQISGLNPNRLTYALRTRSTDTAPTIPLTNSDWDNEIDPGYGYTGTFFHQEHGTRSGLVNSGGSWWGLGDSDAPIGLSPQHLNPKWINVRVYKRRNMNNKGLPA